MAKDKDEGLSEMLGVRVSKADLERIDALAARLPIGSRHGIARVALRIGLEAIERNPMILLGEPVDKSKRGRR
jgi:hypothetical protein